ncbi:MAG: ABC transporter permease [Gammaproteobacteria bacterium]|nr:ABC transporter permease [Gammaproteobacteria bacterium]
MKLLRSLTGLMILFLAWVLVEPTAGVLLPPLKEVIASLADLAQRGWLIDDVLASLYRVVVGVCLSFLLASFMGFIAVYWKTFPDYIAGGFEIIRPVPPIAWVPLALIAFGVGDKPAIAIVALGAFFPIWLGMVQGIRNVNPSHLHAAASLGCTRRLLLTDIIIPSALPDIAHGLRLGVGLAWFCVVAAEMMGAASGLGYGIQLFSQNLEISRMYVYLLAIGLLGYLSNVLLESVADYLNGWRS